MKRLFSILFFSALFLLSAVSGFCTPMPIDISSSAGWVADDGVTVNEPAGVVSFSEQDIYNNFSWGSFFNNNFLVDAYATFLTFDYTLTLGVDDSGDFLQFDLQDSGGTVYSFPPAYDDPSGSGSINLTAYRGQTVALIWTLGYGDFELGTTATLSNIKLDTAPIPEPSAVLLIGLGLMALANRARKKV